MRAVDEREKGTDEKLAQLRREDCILGGAVPTELGRHDERRRGVGETKMIPTDRTEGAGKQRDGRPRG
jgi:hypothetical protein